MPVLRHILIELCAVIPAASDPGFPLCSKHTDRFPLAVFLIRLYPHNADSKEPREPSLGVYPGQILKGKPIL